MKQPCSKTQLIIYLNRKRRRLSEIRDEFSHYPELSKLFEENNWYSKVESQIFLWENNLDASLKERNITISDYELFRYLEEDRLLTRFISSLNAIEEKVKGDPSKYQQWEGS